MTDLFSPRFILIWNSRKCAVFAKIFLINMWHQGVEMGSKLTPETSRTFLKGPYFYDIRSGGERLRALPSQQADKRKEGYLILSVTLGEEVTDQEMTLIQYKCTSFSLAGDLQADKR